MATSLPSSSDLEEFKQRAERAEEQIQILKERLNTLEGQLDDAESKSNLKLGAPSSMGDDYQLNLRYLCQRSAKVQPNSEIVTRIADGKYHRITYKRAQEIATQLASALSKQGIKIGDRIGTFMWNNSRHMCLYYAVPSMGAVLHTLNIRLSKKELSYIINHAKDKIIFVDATILKLFEQIDEEILSSLQLIVICGQNEESGGWKSQLKNTMDFDEFLATGDKTFEWPLLDERSGAALCYTSGTTGNPKGVMYSHRSCYLETLYICMTDILHLSGTESILPVVPMFHALAWCTSFAAYCLGFKYVLYNCHRQPLDFLNMIVDEEVNHLLGVPTVLNGIKMTMEKKEIYDKYIDKIKGKWTKAACGGSNPPSSMIKWYWDELGIEVIHGWGMTETTAVGSVSRRVARRCDLNKTDEEKFENQIPQGLMCTLVEAKIVRPDDYTQELEFDGESMGELLIRGPNVAKKYYNIDAQHKFYKGWLLTGDIATITKDYKLILKDRSKDLIKSGGEWISSVALENEIMSINGVDKACVIGVKHPKFQERPIVIIQMKDELKEDETKRPSLEDIKQHLLKTEKFAKYQLPDDVIFDNIPLTGTGKMSKKDCREKLVKENYTLPEFRKTE